MVSVIMLTTTHFNGLKAKGSTYSVPKAVAERWEKRHIAAIIHDVEENKEKSFEDMSAKELYNYCVEQGLDVEPKMKKKYYLDIINGKEAEGKE